jgi:hypothetical protein
MAASTVDIYANNVLLLDDVDFRTASAFTPVPAGVNIQVDIAPGNSTSVANSIATFNYTLAANTNYILVADGIVSATGYNPGNTGTSAFDIKVYNMGQLAAGSPSDVDVLVHHGATDAPAVDVVNTTGGGNSNLVTNISYGDFAGYTTLPVADYRLEVRPAGATNTVGSYEVPLATLGLGGAAVVVVASGFLDPSQNSNGEAFGLWAALPAGGPLVELMPSMAQVQLIHNSADAAAATVDVYLGDDLALDDVDFRTASAFIDVPAVVGIDLGVAPGNSTSSADIIASFSYNLDADATYVIVADGIISSTGYMPGNTGASAFDLKVYSMGRTAASSATEVDVLVHHGATDAPAVDVVNTTAGANANLVSNAAYGDFAGYLTLPVADYRLEVRPAGATTAVGSYEASLATLGLGGSAAVVVASGFLDPSMNSNGADFGLWVALPTGGALVELPMTMAKVQLIHNSADAAAATVDVYLGNDLALDDVAFRTASAYIDVPAVAGITLSVAPGNSTSVADAIATFNYNLDADMNYVIVADGIISGTGYIPGNAGLSAFDLKVYPMARMMATNSTDVDALVHHGATDAPTVDVRLSGSTAAPLVDDISYGEFDGYIALDGMTDYDIDVTDASGNTVIATYELPVSSLPVTGETVTVVASGFLDPSMNSNGEKFGLWVATVQGGNMIELQEKTTNVNRLNGINGLEVSIAPNPVVSNNLRLNTTTQTELNTLVEVVDMQGKIVLQLPQTALVEGEQVHQFNLNNLPNGQYLLRLSAEEQQATLPFTVIK